MDTPPFYRLPGGISVPAQVTSLIFADYTLVDTGSPLPVYQAAIDPGMVTTTMPPFYLDPAGVEVPANVSAIILSDGSMVGPGNPLPVTGGGGGGSAYDITYTTPAHPDIENVGEALDTIFYVPTDITAFSGGGTFEIGSSIASVNLAWSINKAVTSQSINNGVGSLDPSLRALNVPGPFTSNQSWTLTASDGTTSDNASTSLSFARKRYWGASAEEELDNSQILALSQEFASNNDKAVTYDCSGGKYPYFCYPTSFGTLSAVTVGGLAFSDYNQQVQSFTNASGHTENYYVTRFNGIQFGAAINVVWS